MTRLQPPAHLLGPFRHRPRLPAALRRLPEFDARAEDQADRRSTISRAVCRNIDVERVHTLRLFNFGEPLLHRKLAAIVAEIPKQRWRASVVEISTNAQWVDWDDFEEMLKLEVVNRLVVSCDGDASPESYERLRPPSQWEKLIEFLERAAALRDRYAPAMQLATRSVIETREDARRWEELLRPRGWTPEFRRWMALPEAKENRTGRAGAARPAAPCVFLADASEYAIASVVRRDQPALRRRRRHGRPLLHASAGGRVRQSHDAEVQRDPERRGAPPRCRRRCATNRAAMPVCGGCDVGPVGNEGASFWSPLTFWSAGNSELPER